MEKKFWFFVQGAALAMAAGLVILLSFYMASFLLAVFLVLIGMSALINGVWYLYRKYTSTDKEVFIKFSKPAPKQQKRPDIIDAEYEIVDAPKKSDK